VGEGLVPFVPVGCGGGLSSFEPDALSPGTVPFDPVISDPSAVSFSLVESSVRSSIGSNVSTVEKFPETVSESENSAAV
jgi:hypothetical protein